MKKIISVILLLSLLTLTSCGKNIYPKGFTGGIGIERGSGRQVAWVETSETFPTYLITLDLSMVRICSASTIDGLTRLSTPTRAKWVGCFAFFKCREVMGATISVGP